MRVCVYKCKENGFFSSSIGNEGVGVGGATECRWSLLLDIDFGPRTTFNVLNIMCPNIGTKSSIISKMENMEIPIFFIISIDSCEH